MCLCDLKMADKLFDDRWLLYLDFKFWCWSCIFRFFLLLLEVAPKKVLKLFRK